MYSYNFKKRKKWGRRPGELKGKGAPGDKMKVNRKIKCYVLPLKASCFGRSEKKFLTPVPLHLSQAQAQSVASVTLTSGLSF